MTEKKEMISQTALSLAQTLTGLALILFLAVHLFGSSTINLGGEWFNFYASHLNKENLFVKSFVSLIGLFVVVHGINGLRVVYSHFQRPETHRYIGIKYRDSTVWYFHFLSGIFVAVFAAIHLIAACIFASEPITTLEMVRQRLADNYYFAMMAVFLVLVLFHGLNGLRTVFLKYGFFLDSREKLNKIILFIGIAFSIIGINNLFLLRG